MKFSQGVAGGRGSAAGVPVTVNFAPRNTISAKTPGVLDLPPLNIRGRAAHLNGTYQTTGEVTAVNIKLNARHAAKISKLSSGAGVNLPKELISRRHAKYDLTIAGPSKKMVTSRNRRPLQQAYSRDSISDQKYLGASLAGIKSTRI